MRDLLDLRARLIAPGRRYRRLGQSGSAPVAIDDALTVFRGQGPVVVPVLLNDVDPDGGPLFLISAAAALGTATANGDGTVSYAAPQGTPPNVVQFDTVTYEIADQDDNRETGQINVTISEPVLSVDPTAANTLEITAAPETLDITVSDPAAFAGSYQVEPLDLLAGPLPLVPPVVEGNPVPGSTLSARDGLWVYDLAAAPVSRSRQWRRAGQDIPGETGATYVMQAGDEGQGIAVQETLADSYGQRVSVSSPVSLAFQPLADPGVIDWWDADDATTLTESAGSVSGWVSRTGTRTLSQITPAAQPRADTRLLNGRTVLDFAESDFLAGAVALPASGDFACHLVAEIDAVSNAFAGLIAFDATRDFQIDAAADTQFDGRLNVVGLGTSTNFTGGPFSGAVILSIVFDRSGASQAEVFVGNQSRAVMTLTESVDSAGALHVMTNRSKNAGVVGTVGEIVLTTTIANRAEYHGYLAGKWGLV